MMATDPRLSLALDVIGAAEAAKVPLRLFGGLAVRFLCAADGEEVRAGADIDVMALSKVKRRVAVVVEPFGFEPDRHFNALYGYKQLYFAHNANGLALDVVLDRLEMCHTLEVRDRLGITYPTIPPADLLLTKLQIVEINQKDLHDLAALLRGLPIHDGPGDGIDVARVSEVTASDWGWYRTASANLHRLEDSSEYGSEVTVAATTILEAIEAHPKSLAWRIRAKVGERKRWYRSPEEFTH